MDFKVLLGAVMLAGLSVAGCSTKNYGRQPELTDFERQTMSCREIDLEQAKVQGFLSHVREESEFDGRSVLSFLGDFGIGNLMEKEAAVDSANQRLTQLAGAKMQRGCTYAYEEPAQQPYAAPRAYAPTAPASVSARSVDTQLDELNQMQLPYEEYQRRYREITGQ
ncbi:MAG: hypothetical protein E7F70_03315 [Pseudomonas aeruginosa]|jgi:outer membrane murein-binding lipoprotein Lpp|nr:hypothetical protein [Pseudomonas aeruginosa]MDU1552687.1 hypothetical protein [Pseudomonas aeruginosa]MDU3253912.1 hypothetical protein [Pseudomonas aeruginosa]MDU3291596.1 hypothetical protein [Pseudomonas aeruginosa]MDU3585086.1 hypothetical protein [Pseudomonas aeruginosa]